MDRNYLLMKVGSVMGTEMDGDTMLFLESHIPASLNRVCKWVAENRPKGHEKLLSSFVFESFYDYKNTYKSIYLGYSGLVTPEDGFLYEVELELEETGDWVRMEQCNSFTALNLSERHGVPYYMVKDDYLYFVIPSAYSEQNVRVSHFVYKSLDDFPDELEEFLIRDLIGVLGYEQK